ncbi:unnamed protein product [Vitrella brassicaformis CCMP3155]|uniref:Uncharacterized protein n=2 Tax=Vitrella brassicaformis TaxID=1169539 RepID=A0A0G4H3X7_VITBC|nr:unnamed protein product [Vitrella brassicaformis CCMP3155]|eukprot:CEM38410.1 unnamed protein product [Vitrella brassicaformis CCMP3155]
MAVPASPADGALTPVGATQVGVPERGFTLGESADDEGEGDSYSGPRVRRGKGSSRQPWRRFLFNRFFFLFDMRMSIGERLRQWRDDVEEWWETFSPLGALTKFIEYIIMGLTVVELAGLVVVLAAIAITEAEVPEEEEEDDFSV